MTTVFYKELFTDTEEQDDISDKLKFGESLVSMVIGAVTPVSPTTPLVVTLQSPFDNPLVQFGLTGGEQNVSYGFELIITTTARVLTIQYATIVRSSNSLFNPYESNEPESFQDLVDTIEAGKAAIGNAIFPFPPDVDPSGGYVNWEFLDSDGIVYSAGNAYSYEIKSNGVTNTVFAKCIINVPSDIPPNRLDHKYQLRYKLVLNDSQQQVYYSTEAVTVVGLNTVPVGTQPSVELRGDQGELTIVTEELYENVWVEVYRQNTKVKEQRVTSPTRVASGFFYSAIIDTSNMPESLVPYNVIWKYWNGNQPPNRDNTELWVTNASIMSAITDVRAKINKATTTLYGTPDLLYPIPTIMLWLRRGADAFNSAYGIFTAFTMTNALGPVREFWLMFSEKAALEAQYLAEGEKAFNFAGQAISLDVDKTQYLDSAISRIQGVLDNEVKYVKENLTKKGNISGDGSMDPTKLQAGAIGAVGITITNASPWAWRGRGIGF